jgi:hypothetical protein
VRCIERSDTTESRVRPSFPAVAVVFVALLSGGAAGAEDPPGATAKLECAHAPEPGRVRCEVEVRAAAGTRIKWADVVIVSAPPFAPALRARVGPLEASAHEDAVWRWALALAARARGTGELVARVRIVSCVKDACAPSELEPRAAVAVGE